MRRSLRLAVRATAVAAEAAFTATLGGAAVTQRPGAVRSASSEGGKKRKRVKVEPALPLDTQESDKQEAAKRPTSTDEPSTDQWVALCSSRELSCALTLASGQVFSWRKAPDIGGGDAGEWTGVVGRSVYVLRERDAMVECRCLSPPDVPSSDMVAELTRYFRLDMGVAPLYEQWTRRSDRMARVMTTLPGLRLVRQDPVECLFSFICSSNNNIQRIQQMVDKLCAAYGDHLHTCEATARRFHAFPTVDTLAAKCDEVTLRTLGFGYRAPFVVKTARQLQALGGVDYLLGLREEGALAQLQPAPDKYDGSYQQQLMVFAGVGRKVADCVALFSLERLDAIPVDTHVWQIACREFDASLASKKSVTPAVYEAVGDHFRSRFTPFAGWAHSVLFAGDLTAFQPLLAGADGGSVKKEKQRATKMTKVSAKVVVKEEAKKVKRAAGSTRTSAHVA